MAKTDQTTRPNNRRRWAFVGVFLAMQAFFTYKQIDSLPFFNYGMYSAPAPDRHVQPQRVYALFWLNERGEQQRIDLLRLSQLRRDFLLHNLRTWEGVQRLGWKAARADLRAVIHRRFAAILSAEALAYCEQSLLGEELTAARMQAWLQRFLADTRPESGKNWRIRVEAYDFWAVSGRREEAGVVL